MQKILLFIVVSFICADSQAQSPKQVKAIAAVLQMQQDAWNRGDIPAFMEDYWKSDSLKFMGASGITYGWQATIDRYKKTYNSPEKMGKLDFTLLHFTPLGKKHYQVIGKWHLTRSVGNVGGYFSLTFRRFGKHWKIITDHTS